MSSGSPATPPAAGAAGRPLPPVRPVRPPRRILLMQLKWLGDVLLTTPAIRALRRAYPEARIDFVTGPEGAAVLEGNPHLTEILVARRGLRSTLGTMAAIARRRYDAVLDFRSTPRDAWYVAASRAPLRIGMRGRGPRTLAYTHLFDRGAGPAYMAARKLEPLRALGIDPATVSNLGLELVLGAAERAFADALLARVGLAGDAPIVAISPVTRVHYKQWGAERWAEVADRIAGSGARVLLTSGPGELAQARAVAERMRHPAVYDYGGCSIRQLAAVYQRCALWVGNDGGAKHVAAAVGTPTVSVFRHRESAFWTELGERSPHLAIERPPVLPCIYPHCGKCGHLSCLEQVKVSEVAGLVERAYGRATAGSGSGRGTAGPRLPDSDSAALDLDSAPPARDSNGGRTESESESRRAAPESQSGFAVQSTPRPVER